MIGTAVESSLGPKVTTSENGETSCPPETRQDDRQRAAEIASAGQSDLSRAGRGVYRKHVAGELEDRRRGETLNRSGTRATQIGGLEIIIIRRTRRQAGQGHGLWLAARAAARRLRVVVVVPELSVGSVPYTKLKVVALPSGSTSPSSVAPVDVIDVADTVVTPGLVTLEANVMKLRIAPVDVPPPFVACTAK